MYIYICIYTCIYIHIYIYIYLHTYLYVYIHTYIHTYMYIYIFAYIPMSYVYLFIYIYIHTDIHICKGCLQIYIFVFIYLYMFIYVHTYIHRVLRSAVGTTRRGQRVLLRRSAQLVGCSSLQSSCGAFVCADGGGQLVDAVAQTHQSCRFCHPIPLQTHWSEICKCKFVYVCI